MHGWETESEPFEGVFVEKQRERRYRFTGEGLAQGPLGFTHTVGGELCIVFRRPSCLTIKDTILK